MSREACQAVLDKQGYALRENSGNKRVLLELGGALKVLTKQEKHRLPAPPPPPPPPNAERLFSWRVLERRRGHVRRHVLKLISRVGRHDRTAWGQLKSVALMVPDTSRFPLDPTWVLRVAGSLDLDLLGFRPEGGHALLPAIIALARAPAPAHWQRIAGSAEALARGEEVEYDYERVVTGTVTGERCRGHPAARAVHDMVHGLKKRAMKCAAGLPTDRWIQFAKPDAQGELQPHEP